MINVTCKTEDLLPISALTEFQGGLKTREPSDIDRIIKSIRKHGFAFPFFVWKHDGINNVFDGHGRLMALKLLQSKGEEIPALPVVYIHAKDEKEAKELLLKLNSNYGKMTQDSVIEFLDGLQIDFDDIALPDTTIDFNVQEEETETENDDEVPDVQEEAVSKLGEMYELGNSILMCGDSTNEDDVSRLINGNEIDLIFTDPPYNFHYAPEDLGKSFKKTKERIKNIIDFDAANISYITKLNPKSVYIFTSKDLIPDYFKIFENWKFNILTWIKTNNPPMCQNTFLPDIEYLLYFHNGNRIWNNGLRPLDIYRKAYFSSRAEGQKEAGNVHPTMKPVKLITDKLQISSNENSIVLDLFGGSGSTLIACEKSNRKARVMELDPHYCDVIRRRYTTWAKENHRPITSGCLD